MNQPIPEGADMKSEASEVWSTVTKSLPQAPSKRPKQRKLKFRAYSHIVEGFVEPFLLNFDGIIIGPAGSVEVTQFVGLYDRHGKEIYENDIVRLTHIEDEGHGWRSNYKEVGIVYFDKDWGVKFDCRDFTQRVANHWSDDEMPRDYTKLEIIGNIYEGFKADSPVNDMANKHPEATDEQL